MVQLRSKSRKDHKGREIDYRAVDKKQQTRSFFVAEIKALNKQRAAFGDKPLGEQIAQLDPSSPYGGAFVVHAPRH